MGIVTDFVIAEASEAKTILSEPAPLRRWPGVEAKSIDTIRLSTLAAIISGKSQDADSVAAYSDTFTFLASSPDNERHVVLLPADLVNALGRLKADVLPSVARAWLKTEEFQADGWWKENDVLEIVQMLHKLAGDAIRANKPMLLYWSL